ncbi:hypothetical protein FJZ27_02475 [Candidatus Peribacteria bacterium]|nr:hypothetical protein [Candidatus Peribacteria bacterium]
MTTLIASTRAFAHRHDELPALHAAYLVVAVLSAALFSFGLFAALIALHMALDIVKYRELHRCTWRRTLQGVLRESLRDIMLLSVGLACTVYLDRTMGLIAVSGLVRLVLVVASAVVIVAPKYFILNESVMLLSHMRHYLSWKHPRMDKGWNALERTQIGLAFAAATLIVAASSFMSIPHAYVVDILLQELVDWI